MKHLTRINFYYTFFAICIALGNATAQDITVSPKVCYFSAGQPVKINITSKDVEFSSNNSDCPGKLLVTSSNVVFQQASSLLFDKISITKNNIELEINPQTLFLEGFYNLTVGAGEPCAQQCNSCVEFKKRRIQTTNVSDGNDRYTLKVLLTTSGYTFASNKTVATDTNLFLQKENIQFVTENTLTISDLKLTRISKDSMLVEAKSAYPLWKGVYYLSYINLPIYPDPQGFLLEAPQVMAKIEEPIAGVKSKFIISVKNMKFSKTDTSNCITKLNVQVSDVVFKSASNTILTPNVVSDVIIQDSIITGYVQLPINNLNFTAQLLNRQGCNIAPSEPISIVPVAQVYYTPKLQIENPTVGVKSKFQITIPNVKFIDTGVGNCTNKLRVTVSDVRFYSASGYFYNPSAVTNVLVGDSLITGEILLNNTYNIYAQVNNADGCNGYNSNQIALLPAVVAPKIYTVTTAEANRGEVLNIKANVASNLYFTKSGISDCSKNGVPNVSLASINPKDMEISNGTVSYNVDSASVFFANASQINSISIAWKVPLNAPLGNYRLVLRKGVGCNFESSETIAIVPVSQVYYTPKLQIENPTVGVKSKFQITIPNVKFIDTGVGNCTNKLRVSISDVVFASSTGFWDSNSAISNLSVGDSAITGEIFFAYKISSIVVRVYNQDGCNGNISNQIAVLPAVVAPKIYTITTSEANRGEVLNIKANVASNLYFTKSGISDCSKNGVPNVSLASINPKDMEISNGTVSYTVDSASVLYANTFQINSVSIAWKVPENAPLGNYRLVLRKGVGCNFESSETVTVVCKNTAFDNIEITGPKEVCKNTTHVYKIGELKGIKYNWKVYNEYSQGGYYDLDREVYGDSVAVNFDQFKRILLTAENGCGKVSWKQISPQIDMPVEDSKPYQIAGEDSSVVNGVKAYLPYTTELLNNYTAPSEKYTRVQYKWVWKVLSGGVLIDTIPQDSLMKNMGIVKWTQTGTHQLSATPYNSCTIGKPHLFSVVVGNKNSKPIIYTDVAIKIYDQFQEKFRVYSSTVGGDHDWNFKFTNGAGADLGAHNLSTLNKKWRTTAYVNGLDVFFAILSETISTSGSAARSSDSIRVQVYPIITSLENNRNTDGSQSTIECYPNPASQLLTVSLKNWEVAPIQISIVDPLGKEVYSSASASIITKIDVEDIENGIYLLKISNGKQVKFEKIAIQK